MVLSAIFFLFNEFPRLTAFNSKGCPLFIRMLNLNCTYVIHLSQTCIFDFIGFYLLFDFNCRLHSKLCDQTTWTLTNSSGGNLFVSSGEDDTVSVTLSSQLFARKLIVPLDELTIFSLTLECITRQTRSFCQSPPQHILGLQCIKWSMKLPTLFACSFTLKK